MSTKSHFVNVDLSHPYLMITECTSNDENTTALYSSSNSSSTKWIGNFILVVVELSVR